MSTDDMSAQPVMSAILEPLGAGIELAPGSVIGPYKVLQVLGEGGFGTVCMAEQQHPVHRRVALKLMKAGLTSREFIARFEAERQALAMMDHPNIARVLDAGATDSGRPYLVMELVRGVPITEYCDTHRLDIRQRLELFLPVCHAVQHAHQKGIIHRDLKPSNILVSMQDGKPVPKVIDFGIAKALETRLTDKTVITQVRQFIGTPLYTSPEQAAASNLDIDTRSDIYTLGALLYELLCGATPFEPEVLEKASALEVQRILREVDPPPPSARLAGLPQERREQSARNRRADVASLVRNLRRELDWIAGKAMEKDRTRRYETANALAMDIRRYLENEPVFAGPPGALYRFRKLAGRYRGILAAAAVIVVALLVSTIVSTTSYLDAVRERDAAKAARAEAEQAREAFEREAKLAREILDLLGTMLERPDDESIRRERQALETTRALRGRDHGEVADRLSILGTLLALREQFEEAEKHFAEALDIRFQRLGPGDHKTVRSLYELGRCRVDHGQQLASRGDSQKAQEQFELARAVWAQAMEIADDQLKDPDHWLLGIFEVRYGQSLAGLHQYEQAERMLIRGHEKIAQLGPHHFMTRWAERILIEFRRLHR